MIYSGSFEAAVEELAFAYENVRFFRRHMEAAGLRPADITTPEAFRRIPPTAKVHYRKNYPAGVIARGQSLTGRFVHTSTSSGTGGERLVTATHTYSLAQRMNHTLFAHRSFRDALMSAPGRRTCRYAAPSCSDVECATPASTPEDRTLPDGTLVLPVYHDLLATTEEMVTRAIDEILWYEPHWLYIDPTHLAFLIRHMRARGAPPPAVRAIALTYTQCTAVSRRQIESFFRPGVIIADVLAMTEFGWIGMECPLRTHHINTSSFYAEFLVGDRPAEAGELAELVLTSIGDRLAPHIRYRTGDCYRLLEGPCACGCGHTAVRQEGRARDLLVRDSGVVLTPRELDDIIGPAPWIDIYKLQQLDLEHFVFHYIPNQCFELANERRLEQALRGALGGSPSLRMEATSYIAGERSGKFISCVSDLSARRGEA